MGTASKLQIELLGEMRVVANDVARSLPRSRKTRGLLAYLALNERRLRRDELCELLWDTPGDPRGALRWSLSKLRALLNLNGETVLLADRETVALDRDWVSMDIAGLQALVADPASVHDEALMQVEHQFDGGYLNGLDDAGSHRFGLWLVSEQKRMADIHRRVLDELISRTSMSPLHRLQFAAKRVALDPLQDASNIEYLRLTMDVGGLSESRRALEKVRKHYHAENHGETGLLAAWSRMTRGDPAARDSSAIGAHLVADDQPVLVVHELPDKPSLAVLNFSDLGSHPEGAVLANGLAVDINSRLAQLPSLFVIARQSSQTIDARRLSPRQIGTRLGIRYLIGGSTQRQATRVRVTVTLVDASDERELWSEHFDRPLEHLFEIQDYITHAVVAAVEPAIERAEMQRSLIKSPDNLTAWECFHRGLWHCFRFTQNDNETAHRLFQQAVSSDPHFSRAHAGISFTHYSRAFLHAATDPEDEIRKAVDTGRQSVDFDGRDAMGHWALGRALFLSRQHDNALDAIGRSLALNPNYAQGYYARGFVGIHAGLDDASLQSLDTAQRLSPFDPLLFAMKSSRGISLANQQRYDEAASWAIRATQEPNAHFHIYAVAAACLELAGRLADARLNTRYVLTRRPDYSVEVFRRSFPHKDEASREPFLAALARAGIPRRS